MTNSAVKTLSQLANHDEFIQRHIGPDAAETAAMLSELGVDSIEALIAQTVPADIRLTTPLATGPARTEADALAVLKQAAAKNKMFKSYIGMGYHPTLTPNVILRNVLENPGWYTAYTPYQPEIAQGRLESLLNFQQLTLDLTGMELASASLLDEATAAAEAMALAKRVTKSKSNLYFISDDVHPQTIDVVKTRAEMFGFDILVGKAADAAAHDVFGALIQYPTTNGDIRNDSALIAALQAKKAIVAVATDPMALMLLKSPGQLGADVVLAVLARRPTRPLDFDRRVKAVSHFRTLDAALALAAANKRVSNILAKVEGELPTAVKPELLVDAAEKALATQVAELQAELAPLFAAGDYQAALTRLAALREPVDTFFNEVMVMADDEALKANRLALLNNLRNLFLQVADISLLQ